MTDAERALWMSIRQALLLIVAAIELYIGVKRRARTENDTSTPRPTFTGPTSTQDT